MKKKLQSINAILFPSLSVYIATAAVFHLFIYIFLLLKLLTTKANEAYEYYFNYCYFSV